jgi:hypothetical protein
MELLSASWARARENSGRPCPSHRADEAEVALHGHLESLHHLVSYFSEEHNARLSVAAAKAEEEALENMKAVHDRQGLSARALVEKRLLEEAKMREATNGAEAKQITHGEDADQAPYNTARSEVALAWLQIAVLPDLQKAEVPTRRQAENDLRPGGPSTSTSESFPDSLRPGSSASDRTHAANSSSRATSPTSAPTTTSSSLKGKGKARAAEEPHSFSNGSIGISSNGKGKGRAL